MMYRPNSYPISQMATTLNFDILLVVQAYIEQRRDLLSMMQTCKTMYATGVRYLMESPSLNQPTNDQIRSFSRFMLARPSSSFPRLTSLSLVLPDDADAEPLVEVLHRARPYLRTLHLDCDVALSNSQAFYSSLISLDNITELSVVNPDLPTLTLLNESFAPIHKISVVNDKKWSDFCISHLANFGDSLEELVTSKFNLFRNYPHEKLFLNALRTLVVDYHYDNMCLASLLPGTPNLERLIFNMFDQGIIDSGEIEDHHICNQHIAEDIALRLGGHTCWEHLKYVEGDCRTLYVGALLCSPIQDLNMTSLTNTTVEYFPFVFDFFLPSRTRIYIPADEFRLQQLTKAFKMTEDTSGLHHLRLDIEINDRANETLWNFSMIREELSRLLKGLTLTHFDLRLHIHESSPLFSSYAKLDVQSFAKEVIIWSPSLRYVRLDIYPRHGARTWRVVHVVPVEKSGELDELSLEQSRNVMRVEGF
ncbi:hypothetical protein C8Q75DRAFT_773104 [Abortiporus biennis]|nr:hypothetical protein C8Q75DRAFT_773104 [Abortiporus biennis]